MSGIVHSPLRGWIDLFHCLNVPENGMNIDLDEVVF